MDKEDMIYCPFNKSHSFAKYKLIDHLSRCKDTKKSNKTLFTCLLNSLLFFIGDEQLAAHMRNCIKCYSYYKRHVNEFAHGNNIEVTKDNTVTISDISKSKNNEIFYEEDVLIEKKIKRNKECLNKEGEGRIVVNCFMKSIVIDESFPSQSNVDGKYSVKSKLNSMLSGIY